MLINERRLAMPDDRSENINLQSQTANLKNDNDHLAKALLFIQISLALLLIIQK